MLLKIDSGERPERGPVRLRMNLELHWGGGGALIPNYHRLNSVLQDVRVRYLNCYLVGVGQNRSLSLTFSEEGEEGLCHCYWKANHCQTKL